MRLSFYICYRIAGYPTIYQKFIIFRKIDKTLLGKFTVSDICSVKLQKQKCRAISGPSQYINPHENYT